MVNCSDGSNYLSEILRSITLTVHASTAQEIMTAPAPKQIVFENGFGKNNALIAELLKIVLDSIPLIIGSLLIILGIVIIVNDSDDYAPAITFALLGGFSIMGSFLMGLLLRFSQAVIENTRRTTENTAAVGLLLQQILQRQTEMSSTCLQAQNISALTSSAANAVPAPVSSASSAAASDSEEAINVQHLTRQEQNQPIHLDKPQAKEPMPAQSSPDPNSVESIMKIWLGKG